LTVSPTDGKVHRKHTGGSVRRSGRLLLAGLLVVAGTLLPAPPAAAATPAEAVAAAVATAANRSVTSFISVVDRQSGAVLARTGNADSQVASESIMKLLLASYYLVLYGGYQQTPDAVKTRLSYMLRYSDNRTTTDLFTDSAIPTIAARYGMSNTTNATDRVGHWGAARITAADMTTFLYRAAQDAQVGPWLVPVMAQTERTGSGGDAAFDQFFGLNAIGGDHGSKQGWGCDSFWTSPTCAIHSVGYTDTAFVAILQLGNGYPDPMRAVSTNSAQLIYEATDKPAPIGSLDVVTNPAPGALRVVGWAADPADPGREEVHVYVTGPAGRAGFGGIFTQGSRPDVAALFPWAGGSTGFAATVTPQGEGPNTVCAYAITVTPPRTNPGIGCRTVQVRNSFGNLDVVAAGRDFFAVQGWAVNPNNPAENVQVHVYDYGPGGTRVYGDIRANTSRTDVAAVFPAYSANHGFATTIPSLEEGTHTVCAYGITTGGGAGNSVLGCRTIQVRNAFGSLDLVGVQGDRIVAAGWALNPNTPAESVQVHVYDTSRSGTRGYAGFQAGNSRPDVGAAYPGYGPNHGYWASIPSVESGPHTVCTYAITTGGGVSNGVMGCRSVTVP
jgi:hypothetical protein